MINGITNTLFLKIIFYYLSMLISLLSKYGSFISGASMVGWAQIALNVNPCLGVNMENVLINPIPASVIKVGKAISVMNQFVSKY